MTSEKIEWGIITAPREVPTLGYSVRSFRRYFDDHLTVFAEPGLLAIDASRTTVIFNTARRGALKNYDKAVRHLLKHSDKPLICVLEDDYIYGHSFPDRVREIESADGEFGYYNLFTNANNPILRNIEAGWQRRDLGWNDAWGVAYVFRREILERILMQEYYMKAFERTDRNIDAVISETLLRMGLGMWYHNPSPTCSFGIVSTLGHECKTDGLNFKI